MIGDAGPLQGRIILVTGASRGLGKAVVLATAAAGATVIASARRRAALEAVDDAVSTATGRSATLLPLDLQDIEKLAPVGPSIYQRFGRLDAFVHCAGIVGRLMPVAQLDLGILRKAVEINLLATQALIATLDPLLRAAPAARALFVTDHLAGRGRPFFGAYSASKQGMEALVLAYAAEVRQTGLAVRLVAPPPMRTALRADAYPGEGVAKQTPPEDVAARMVGLLAAERMPDAEVLDL